MFFLHLVISPKSDGRRHLHKLESVKMPPWHETPTKKKNDGIKSDLSHWRVFNKCQSDKQRHSDLTRRIHMPFGSTKIKTVFFPIKAVYTFYSPKLAKALETKKTKKQL